MEQEKQQLISTLLGLKAGLSLLHNEVEKITTAEQSLGKANADKSEAERSVRDAKWSLECLERKAEEQSVELKEFQDKQNKKKKEGTTYTWGGIALLIGGIVCAIVGSGVVRTMGILAIIMGFVCWWRGSKILHPGQFGTPNPPKTDAILSLRECNASYKRKIFDCENNLKAKTATYVAADNAFNKTYAEVYPCAKIIYDTLYDTYDDTLRMEQWQYLDLIIYYLYCDIADTKKEALQLVEQERLKREIVEAIQNASDKICNTICTEMELTRFKMGMHFDKLSAQISAYHKNMNSAMDSVTRGLAENASRLSEINNAQNIKNELLNKIEVNSKTLADSANYIARKVR